MFTLQKCIAVMMLQESTDSFIEFASIRIFIQCRDWSDHKGIVFIVFSIKKSTDFFIKPVLFQCFSLKEMEGFEKTRSCSSDFLFRRISVLCTEDL